MGLMLENALPDLGAEDYMRKVICSDGCATRSVYSSLAACSSGNATSEILEQIGKCRSHFDPPGQCESSSGGGKGDPHRILTL